MQHAHSSYVRLSLDNEDFMKAMKPNVNSINSGDNNMNSNVNNTNAVMNNNQQYSQSEMNNDDVNILNKQVWEINKGKRVIKKSVEIVTTITYIYEDGSQRVLMEKKCHDYIIKPFYIIINFIYNNLPQTNNNIFI